MKKIKYTQETFIEEVTKEVEALKKYATKEEIDRLDFSNFDGRDYKRCIYGQMTGDCFSNRASDLIFKCCQRYFYNSTQDGGSPILFANGKKVAGIKYVDDFHSMRQNSSCYFSTIEAYIMSKDADPEQLISYLKDETKTLTL